VIISIITTYKTRAYGDDEPDFESSWPYQYPCLPYTYN